MAGICASAWQLAQMSPRVNAMSSARLLVVVWAVETAAGLAAVGLEVALGLDGLEVGVMAAEPAEETAEALRARVGIPVALAVAVAGVAWAAAAAFRAGGW